MCKQHVHYTYANLVWCGFSQRNCLNQHLRQSPTSEDLLHICSQTEHPNTKQIHSFLLLLTRWSRPNRDWDAWEQSELLKADWHWVTNQLHKRVREPKMGIICKQIHSTERLSYPIAHTHTRARAHTHTQVNFKSIEHGQIWWVSSHCHQKSPLPRARLKILSSLCSLN